MTDSRDTILTVCTANICRSPMAERLLRHALAAEAPPLGHYRAESAGLAADDGEPASPHSVTALNRVSLDLTDHRSQSVSEELLGRSFAVFAMTPSHLELLRQYFSALPDRLHLLREFMPDASEHSIPDPVGQDLDAYIESLNSMIEAIPSIIAYLRQEAG